MKLRALTSICLVAIAGSAFAGEVPWTDSSYYHFAQNQSLEDLIRDFTAIQGVDVVINSPLSGTVNGIFEGIPPVEFWDNLSKAYNLSWFYDGSILYVYPGSSISTQVIAMTPHEGSSLKAVVGEMDFASSSCSLRYMPATKMMVMSGPPRFLEVVHGLLDSIQTNTIQNFTDETVVQVFPLKYAFAYDVSLSVGAGDGVTIEGIATLLQRILSGINSVPQTSQEVVCLGGGGSSQPVEGVLQRKEGSRQPAEEPRADGRGTVKKPSVAAKSDGKVDKKPSDGQGNSSAAGGDGGNPMRTPHITSITYDARLNAVIVRDHRDLMPFYQSLIERFDIPTRTVEIQVAIVDVDVGHSREIGIDVVRFLNGGSELTWRPSISDAELDNRKINFFAKLNSASLGADIAARLKALEGIHAAKTLSRPSVLTLDNLAAVISRSDETYVSVAGAYAADLFTVSASVALRVIPHIIEVEREDGQTERQIKLFVSIEDGAMDVAGAMPAVSSSQINTQTVLLEGQSLVVGGYYKERHNTARRGVPILQDIPLIGRLFSVNGAESTTVERLFIISPRIIELTAEDGDPYSQFFEKAQLTGQPIMTMESFRADERPAFRRHHRR
jgi:type III secretion protein C